MVRRRCSSCVRDSEASARTGLPHRLVQCRCSSCVSCFRRSEASARTGLHHRLVACRCSSCISLPEASARVGLHCGLALRLHSSCVGGFRRSEAPARTGLHHRLVPCRCSSCTSSSALRWLPPVDRVIVLGLALVVLVVLGLSRWALPSHVWRGAKRGFHAWLGVIALGTVLRMAVAVRLCG